MNTYSRVDPYTVLFSTLLALLLPGCGMLQAAPASTPTLPPPTLTPTTPPTDTPMPTDTPLPTPTPTDTPIPEPSLFGVLLDADGDTPLKGARIMLCAKPSPEACECVLAEQFSAVTDEQGRYEIPLEEPGSYAVFYNSSGEMQEWVQNRKLSICKGQPELLAIPSAQDSIRPLVNSLTNGMLNIKISSCMYVINADGDFSSYLFFPAFSLGTIWSFTGPLDVAVEQGPTELNLAVWKPSKDKCGEVWQPVR